jgi:pyridoxamine 5'-phosphate oxidase
MTSSSASEPRHRLDLRSERVDYSRPHLMEDFVPADPMTLFQEWLTDAFAARDAGVLAEPTAMVVATCAEGRPSARTVLLKDLDADGFVFFTNYRSRKGAELAANPRVGLHFGWYALQRQVRIEGVAERTSRAETEAYFATRPRASQLGAWASPQSAEVGSYEELTQSYRAVEVQFGDGEVPCPPEWGGYRVVAQLIEFWQGGPGRMHDRLQYRRRSDGWELCRIAP